MGGRVAYVRYGTVSSQPNRPKQIKAKAAEAASHKKRKEAEAAKAREREAKAHALAEERKTRAQALLVDYLFLAGIQNRGVQNRGVQNRGGGAVKKEGVLRIIRPHYLVSSLVFSICSIRYHVSSQYIYLLPYSTRMQNVLFLLSRLSFDGVPFSIKKRVERGLFVPAVQLE